jgi:hypothetical protein
VGLSGGGGAATAILCKSLPDNVVRLFLTLNFLTLLHLVCLGFLNCNKYHAEQLYFTNKGHLTMFLSTLLGTFLFVIFIVSLVLL